MRMAPSTLQPTHVLRPSRVVHLSRIPRVSHPFVLIGVLADHWQRPRVHASPTPDPRSPRQHTGGGAMTLRKPSCWGFIFHACWSGIPSVRARLHSAREGPITLSLACTLDTGPRRIA